VTSPAEAAVGSKTRIVAAADADMTILVTMTQLPSDRLRDAAEVGTLDLTSAQRHDPSVGRLVLPRQFVGRCRGSEPSRGFADAGVTAIVALQQPVLWPTET
jgi:hypothetical protein